MRVLLLRTISENARFAAPGLRPIKGKTIFPRLCSVVDCRPGHEEKEGAMPEPNQEDLVGRIESLERANRRWKRLALSLLVALALALSAVA